MSLFSLSGRLMIVATLGARVSTVLGKFDRQGDIDG